jgi:hypothetical protein
VLGRAQCIAHLKTAIVIFTKRPLSKMRIIKLNKQLNTSIPSSSLIHPSPNAPSKQPRLAAFSFASFAAVLLVNLNVVPQMATIAHRLQVLAPRAARLVAKVRRCQRHNSSRPLRRMPMKFHAPPRPSGSLVQSAFAHTLALRNPVRILGPLAYFAADRLPTFRVLASVNRHPWPSLNA